jgi:hypothetical protein
VAFGSGFILYCIGGGLSLLSGVIMIVINRSIPYTFSFVFTCALIGLFSASLLRANRGSLPIIIACVITYMLYIVEALRSSTMKYLDRLSSHVCYALNSLLFVLQLITHYHLLAN